VGARSAKLVIEPTPGMPSGAAGQAKYVTRVPGLPEESP